MTMTADYSRLPVAQDPRVLIAGDRVRFAGHRELWDVRRRQDNFVICTRQQPFSPKGTLTYTVIDLGQGVRGPLDVSGGYGDRTYDDLQIRQMAGELIAGKVQVSRFNSIPVEVAHIFPRGTL